MSRWLLLPTLLLFTSCERPAPTPASSPGTPAAKATKPKPAVQAKAPTQGAKVTLPPWKRPQAARVVAMGDVHGDLGAMRRALRAAGVLDDADQWSGGAAVLVQTGDLLDRGDQEQEIVDLLDRLRGQARASGGDVVEVVGNHESMNVMGDLRYVTPGGYKDFEDVSGLNLEDPRLQTLPAPARARRAAFKPGGPYAMRLAQHNVIVQVGTDVFAHGGVLPQHVAYGVGKINAEMHAWMTGAGPVPSYLQDDQSPMWTRLYARDGAEVCAVLQKTLEGLQAKRLFVGHTPQMKGPTQACDGALWRIDVGMASHYGGTPAALVLEPGKPPQIKTAP